MDITLFIKLGMALIVILAILMFFFFSSRKKAKQLQEKKSEEKVEKIPSLNSLRDIIKNKKTSSSDLKDATELVLKHYAEIKDIDLYMDILFVICVHPNTNKNIIVAFDKEILRLNPTYKIEINGTISKGLNSRSS